MKECISVKKGTYLATQMHKFYILWFIKQENHKTIRSQVEKRLKERWRFWAENGKKTQNWISPRHSQDKSRHSTLNSSNSESKKMKSGT